MTKAGVVRAEGIIVTNTEANDRVVIQRFNQNNNNFEPRQINVANLPSSGGAFTSNAGQVNLTAGTATVTNALVTADSIVFLTVGTLGTVTEPQAVAVTDVSAGSFTITSADNTDTSQVNYTLIAINN